MEDIRILECSRLSSVEGKSGNDENPALFTCKMGEVIQLKEGDKVNVEYSFINELGCGGETIEIKGRNLGVTKKFMKTKITNVGDNSGFDRKILETARRQTAENIEDEIMLRDDEVNIPLEFYKNANGEGHFFLPRHFLRRTLTSPTSGAVGHEVNEIPSIWNDDPSTTTGIDLNPIAEFTERFRVCGADAIISHIASSGSLNQATLSYVIDNSRFTVFIRDDTFFTVSGDNADENIFKLWNPDLALRNYIIYKDYINIKVGKGYNSPADIATTITQQLQKTDEAIEYYINDGGGAPGTHNIKIPKLITKSTASPTYRPFNCACLNSFMKENADKFYTGDLTADKISDESVLYDASLQYIGVKRPDLFILGRELCNAPNNGGLGNFSMTLRTELRQQSTQHGVGTIPITDRKYKEMVLKIEYTRNTYKEDGTLEQKGNLEMLRDLFIAQGTYPELFNARENEDVFGGTKRNKTNSRFLHINAVLGGEYLGEDISGYPLLMPNRGHAVPLFFYCNENNLNREGTGNGIKDLCFGFATKTENAGKYYITIHPEIQDDDDIETGTLHDLPIYLTRYWSIVYDPTPPTIGYFHIPSGLWIVGWDNHFRSWGNVTMGFTSGFNNWSYDIVSGAFGISDLNSGTDNQGLLTGGYMSKTYIGANNPSVEFLTSGHFGIDGLHTEERVGQSYNAGDNLTTNAIVEDSSNAVYKINKRLNYWTFCPDACPYNITGTASAVQVIHTTSKTTDKTYEPFNRNMREWSIFDSHSGVFFDLINSYTPETYRFGLLGILGYTENQFKTDKLFNKQLRIDYNNINNLPFQTTNAEITQTESINYNMNIYGGIQYTTQLPAIMSYVGYGVAGRLNTLAEFYEDPAEIVEQQTSIKIIGEKLPRKMLRPYFTVRSDIITDDKYIGGDDSGIRLGIVGVINKENGDGDFYFSSESPLEFTITKPISFSSITTSIHDPDQSYSNLSPDSSIIYKITSMKELDKNIFQELLEANKPK